MTLKQINSLPITKAQANGCETSKLPTESGCYNTVSFATRDGTEKMRDTSITILRRTTMVEDGVSSLVPLELDVAVDYELRGCKITGSPDFQNLQKALKKVEASLLPLPQEEIEKTPYG